MITKWDIISRVEPKTRLVRYTLVVAGAEADARVVAKKLGGYVLAIKRALSPYTYAFRLPSDLDEVTLDKIRTAVREVAQQSDKMNDFSMGKVAETPLNEPKITPLAAPKPKVKKEEESAPEPKLSELNLEDATIISPKRILGDAAEQEVAQVPQPKIPAEETSTFQKVKPELPTLEMTKVSSTVPSEAEMMPSEPAGGPAQTPAPQPEPEDKEQAVAPMGNTIVPIGGALPDETLLDIDPEKPQAASGLKRWFHKKQTPAPAKKPVATPKSAAKTKPAVTPPPAPRVEPVAQPAPEPTKQPEPAVHKEEKPAQNTAQAPVAKPKEKILPPRRIKAPAKEQVQQPQVQDDGFPQIHVQVRPPLFDKEEKAATAAPKQAPAAAAETPAVAMPAQVEKQPEVKAPVVAPTPTPQPAPEPVAPVPADPAQEIKPEDGVTLSQSGIPVEPKETVPAQTPAVTEEKVPPQEQEVPREPLNFSLEDMFLAETKYDMFVDVGESETPRQEGKPEAGKAPKPTPKKNNP